MPSADTRELFVMETMDNNQSIFPMIPDTPVADGLISLLHQAQSQLLTDESTVRIALLSAIEGFEAATRRAVLVACGTRAGRQH